MTSPNTAPTEVDPVEAPAFTTPLPLQNEVEIIDDTPQSQQALEAELTNGMLADDFVDRPASIPAVDDSKNRTPPTLSRAKLVKLPIEYPGQLDDESFSIIYRSYLPVLSNFIQQRVPKACEGMHDGESLAQEALLKLYKHTVENRQILKTQGALHSWLHTVVIRDALDLLRYQKRRRFEATDPGDMTTLREDRQPTDDTVAALIDLNDRLRPLAELGEDHRTVLWDHYVMGVPIPTIAEQQGVAPGTIKSRLSRARRKAVGLGVVAIDPGEEFNL